GARARVRRLAGAAVPPGLSPRPGPPRGNTNAPLAKLVLHISRPWQNGVSRPHSSNSNMQIPDIPIDEARRLAALHATRLLGSPPEDAFDRITRMATRLLKVPIALVSLVDKDIQWFKSRCGFAQRQTARDVSFCGHAILDHEPLVVP